MNKIISQFLHIKINSAYEKIKTDKDIKKDIKNIIANIIDNKNIDNKLDNKLDNKNIENALNKNDKKKQKTIHVKNYIDKNIASKLYNKLEKEIEWHDGIKSKKGFTRKAYIVPSKSEDIYIPDIDGELEQIIQYAMHKYAQNTQLIGIYLNYYENGTHYTPNHKHEDTIQLIISLGETRTLNVGTKSFSIGNGDLIIFGSSIHGVPKEQNKKGRISIALFLQRI